MKQFFLLLGMLSFLLFSGCANKKASSNKNSFVQTTSFSVVGEGIAPSNTNSPAHAMVLAKRAAIADAYRQLGEKIYGIRISANENVSNAILKDSRIQTQVNACIRNAQITENSYKDGLYRVGMSSSVKSHGRAIVCSN